MVVPSDAVNILGVMKKERTNSMKRSIHPNISQVQFDFEALALMPVPESVLQVVADQGPKPKYCPRCKQTYPATTEYWHRSKSRKDGLHGHCKTCSNAKHEKYATTNSVSPLEPKRCSVCHQWFPATTEYWQRDKTHKDGFRSSCKECRSKKYAAKEGYDPANASFQKQCTKCEQWFSSTPDHWDLDKDGQYGLSSHCKECIHKAYVARDPHSCIRCHIRTATLDRLCDECNQWKQNNPDAIYCHKCKQWLSADCFNKQDKPKKRGSRVCNSCRCPKEPLVLTEETIQRYNPPAPPKERDPRRDRQNNQRNERSARERAAGMCSKCLARPAEIGNLCQRCHDYQKRYADKLRDEVFSVYGGSCVVCGESCPAFLAIDHIDNDGADHRRVSGGGHRLYQWLRKNGFP